MRIAMLSDIHGNLHALDAVLADLASQPATDQIWVLGDLCVLGAHPAECLARIRALPKVRVLLGNTDRKLFTGTRFPSHRAKDEADLKDMLRWLIARDQTYHWTLAQLSFADYEFLANLPPEFDLHIPGYGWLLAFHGAPGHDEANLRPETPDDEVLDHFLDREARFGVGGHTHVPMDRDLGSWHIVNVGSVGLPKDDWRPCYAIATFEDGRATIEFRRVEYDVQAAAKAVEESGNPGWAWALETLIRKP